MKISILHPSFGRPELARRCYDEWMGKADKPENVEYVLCLSDLDPKRNEYDKHFADAWQNDNLKYISMYKEKGLVVQVNYAALHCDGDLLIAVSDDFGCPQHWDTLLLDALEGKQDYIVKTQDGLQPFIITLPIMDRVYYERFGYIYHPSYVHLYGDEELAEVGKMLGKTVTLPIKFPHRHYSTGAMKKDATNVANDSNYGRDGDNFKQRKMLNFPI